MDPDLAQKAIEGVKIICDQYHMSEYACDFEMAQNSNSSVTREFLLEVLITCFLPKIAPNSKHKILPLYFLFEF